MIHTAHLQWRRGLEKVAQTLPVPPFPGGLPLPQGHSIRGRKKYKINSSIKQRPLVVASWNMRTLQNIGLGARRRTALIACELARYNIDIAALSETRLPDEGSLVEMGTGYTFFWSGLATVARRIHGVGFAVRTALLQSTQESPIAIDERLVTLRLPLAKNRFATFVSVYSPTLNSSDYVKDRFMTRCIPPSEEFRKMTKSYCWAISMPEYAEITTYGMESLDIMVLAT